MTRNDVKMALSVAQSVLTPISAWSNTHHHLRPALRLGVAHLTSAAVAWARLACAFLRTPAALVRLSGALCCTAFGPEAQRARQRASTCPWSCRSAQGHSGELLPPTQTCATFLCGRAVSITTASLGSVSLSVAGACTCRYPRVA